MTAGELTKAQSRGESARGREQAGRLAGAPRRRRRRRGTVRPLRRRPPRDRAPDVRRGDGDLADSMPSGMLLRSAWEETSLSAPGGAGTIDDWVRATGALAPSRSRSSSSSATARGSATDSFPIATRATSRRSSPNGSGYRILTGSGGEFDAERVVIAVGVMPFAYVPPPLAALFGDTVGFSTGRPDDADRHAGRRVLVVGGGQAGLESAGPRRTGRRPRRARDALASALVRGSRAAPARGAVPATPLPSRVSRRRLRAAAAQPARAPPRSVRRAARRAAAPS